MTVAATIDLLARGGTLALLLLWSLVLWRDHRTAPAARAAMAMNAAIASYVISGLLFAVDHRAPVSVLFDVLSVTAPPLFWLFARLWFDDRVRVGRRSWLLIGGFMALPLIQLGIIATTGRFSALIWVLVRIGMVGFGVGGMWVAWRGRANDLVEPRRNFRLALIGAIGGFVLWVNGLEVLHTAGRLTWLPLTLTQLAIVAVTLAGALGLHAIRTPDLFAAPPAVPVRPQALDQPMAAAANALVIRLRHVMEHDRAYRAEGFSIASLAARLGEPEYRVRRTINGDLGFRNFTAFLNSYRLREVKAALIDVSQRDVPILTIAIDAGFGSLGPFNRAFRDSEGMTPSEWRRSAGIADSEIG